MSIFNKYDSNLSSEYSDLIDSSFDSEDSEDSKIYPGESGTPKILHQTWKTEDLPIKYKKWQEKWLKICSDYDYRFYTDEDINEFIRKDFPKYYSKFKSFAKTIERVDFWRYAILYKHGGVYADIDTFPIKNIDCWLEENKIIIGREPIEHARMHGGSDFLLCNAFMISPPGESFWLDLMDYICKKYNSKLSAVDTTGPGIITKFHKNFPDKFDKVEIAEPKYFFPLTARFTDKTQGYQGETFEHISKFCDIKDAFVVHIWENSWNDNVSGPWVTPVVIFLSVALIVLILIISFSVMIK